MIDVIVPEVRLICLNTLRNLVRELTKSQQEIDLQITQYIHVNTKKANKNHLLAKLVLLQIYKIGVMPIMAPYYLLLHRCHFLKTHNGMFGRSMVESTAQTHVRLYKVDNLAALLPRCQALQDQCQDWQAPCQYTVTGWDGAFVCHFCPSVSGLYLR